MDNQEQNENNSAQENLSPPSSRVKEPNHAVMAIVIWFFMLLSMIIIAVIAHVVIFKTVKPGFDQNTLLIFGVMGLINAGLAHFVFTLTKETDPAIKLLNLSPEEKLEKNQNNMKKCILSWAINESVAILAIIMPVIGGAGLIYYSYGLIVLALGLHLIKSPNLLS